MKTLRILLLLLAMLPAVESQAQCSMCRAVASSGAEDDTKKIGQGLNTGILYLLSIPYVLGGVAFGIWYRHRRKN